MPDLNDGESTEVQGSARAPYILKNVGGVYSCSCPAWRNQSIAIERRTCKHLRALRGAQAEADRVGAPPPVKPATEKDGADSDADTAPKLLLAHPWENDSDLTGWWMSEKLDGVRAWWDGKQFLSRQGNVYHAPDWFVAGLPNVPLDGELWLARKAFQRTVSIVRRQDKSDHWREIRYLLFDAPGVSGPFEERQKALTEMIRQQGPQYAKVLDQVCCKSIEALKAELARVESLGGEGLMLRQPGSLYEAGRSTTLFKVKIFHDAEGRVVEHLPGKGRHAGRLGAVVVELPDGLTFSVGTGFSDAQRQNPPAVGSLITYRYQELTDRGVPRFPSFVRLRTDAAPLKASSTAQVPAGTKNAAKNAVKNTPKKAQQQPDEIAGKRYFEFVDGSSAKFWEISRSGETVTVRYGKIGSNGQTQTKTLADAAAATAHAERLILEKTTKGYQETASG
jgi:DNA ligase-1